MSCNSVDKCHIPQIKGSVSQDCTQLSSFVDVNLKSQLFLSFLPTGYKSEVSKTSSVGSVNLLEWFMELREAFIYVYQFIIKDTEEESGEEVYRAMFRRVLSTGASVLQELRV